MNLFSLHGKYFRDDENRLTANLAIILNEARRGFLPAFLSLIGIPMDKLAMHKVRIVIQEGHRHDDERSILDAKLTLDGKFAVIIESKVGFNSISVAQALKYAHLLTRTAEQSRVLVFITQLREPLIEANVLEALDSAGLVQSHVSSFVGNNSSHY